jgi:hypothetical protein
MVKRKGHPNSRWEAARSASWEQKPEVSGCHRGNGRKPSAGDHEAAWAAEEGNRVEERSSSMAKKGQRTTHRSVRDEALRRPRCDG